MTHALITPSDELDETEVDVSSEIMRFNRYWEGEVEIERGGTGRDVTAYLAVFDQQAEIKDQHGHYIEVIDRSAFNRTLAHAADNVSKRVGLFWNHGHDLHGPSALASVPLGSFLEIRADGQGLISRARYNKTPLAESVLQAIKDGDVRGYSFRGPVFRSDPTRVPRIQRGAQLPTVRRMELGLSEGGPTWAPFYAGAGIVAVRSAAALTELRTLPLRERIEVIARAIGDDDDETTDSTPEPDDTTSPETSEVDTPDEGDNETSTTPDPDESTEDDGEDEDPEDDSPTDSDESLGTEDPPIEGTPAGDSEAARSMSQAEVARKARVALILRGGGI
jgi:HK97 family phage prohead protease